MPTLSFQSPEPVKTEWDGQELRELLHQARRIGHSSYSFKWEDQSHFYLIESLESRTLLRIGPRGSSWSDEEAGVMRLEHVEDLHRVLPQLRVWLGTGEDDSGEDRIDWSSPSSDPYGRDDDEIAEERKGIKAHAIYAPWRFQRSWL